MTKRFMVTVLLMLMLFPLSHVQGSVITGERHLAGPYSVSWAMDKYAEITGHSCYPREVELLAQVIYHENYCNGEEAMYLTGSVVINRIRSESFPDTVERVLYERGQYSTTHKFYTVEIPDICYKIALRLLKFGTHIPESVVFQAMFPQGSGIYKRINTDFFCYE